MRIVNTNWFQYDFFSCHIIRFCLLCQFLLCRAQCCLNAQFQFANGWYFNCNQFELKWMSVVNIFAWYGFFHNCWLPTVNVLLLYYFVPRFTEQIRYQSWLRLINENSTINWLSSNQTIKQKSYFFALTLLGIIDPNFFNL